MNTAPREPRVQWVWQLPVGLDTKLIVGIHGLRPDTAELHLIRESLRLIEQMLATPIWEAAVRTLDPVAALTIERKRIGCDV